MLTDSEFKDFIEDSNKTIDGDIEWQVDKDHSPTVEFRAELHSNDGYTSYVKGSYNPLIPALTYAIIHSRVKRIYALDMGKAHRNPDRTHVGEIHKHRWREESQDKWAYHPQDITAPITDPVKVWKQFCEEASIRHNGVMRSPPPVQGDLFLI